jgi:hypothetical protein
MTMTQLLPASETKADDEEVARRMRGDVTRRLRPVCEHLPADAFAVLVDDVCRVKLRCPPRRID